MEEYIDKVMEHKHALIFVGGIAAAIAGKKILESKAVKEGCTKGMAAVLAAKEAGSTDRFLSWLCLLADPGGFRRPYYRSGSSGSREDLSGCG